MMHDGSSSGAGSCNVAFEEKKKFWEELIYFP
jgi:hypothetical protein